MARVLKTLGATLALTLLLAVVLLYRGLDLGFVQPKLEAFASQALDRRITLGSPPRVQLRKHLTIELEDLRIENAEWAPEEPLLTLGQAQASLLTTSLFRKPLEISRLEIRDLQARLITDKRGVSNVPAPSESKGKVEPNEDSQGSLPVVFRDVQINGLRLTHDNRKRGTQAELLIRELQQKAEAEQITLRGDGQFQKSDWNLSLDGSPLRAVLAGEPIDARFNASLAALQLDGSVALPSLESLADLRLQATLQGSLPKQITDLSPILEADAPIELRADVSDIDPGVRVDAELELTQLSVKIAGDVDDPGSGDGLDLRIDADARSLAGLSEALDLGATEAIPVSVDGRIFLRDRQIELRELELIAGEHRLAGEAKFPSFPSLQDALVNLSGQGPDFSIFQRLIQRPETLALPYELRASVSKMDQNLELLDSTLRVGKTELVVSGPLGHPPEFVGSELDLHFNGPSLYRLGGLFAMDFPDTPYDLGGRLQVSDDGLMRLNSWTLTSSLMNAEIEGELRVAPEVRDVLLTLTGSADQLKQIGEAIGQPGLPAQAVSLNFEIAGDQNAVDIRDLLLTVGESSLRSERIALTNIGDGIEIADGAVIEAQVKDLAGLIGTRLPLDEGNDGFSARIQPRLDEQRLRIDIDRLAGPHIDGSATLELGRQLKLDEAFHLDARLTFTNPNQLVPSLGPYSVPPTPLAIQSRTTRSGNDIVVSSDLLSGASGVSSDSSLINAVLRIAEDGSKPLRLHVSGKGPDHRLLGTLRGLEDRPLAYAIDAQLSQDGPISSLKLESLKFGETALRGTASWDGPRQHVAANTHLLNIDLDSLLQIGGDKEPDTGAGSPEASPAPPGDGRLIPDTPLPLAWMDAYQTDITITSDALGIDDPVFSHKSLVDKAALHFQSGGGKADLTVHELRGSRGLIQGRSTLAKHGEQISVQFNSEVTGFPLGITSSAKEYEELPTYDLQLALASEGSTPRALAAALDGTVFMRGGEGTLKDMSLSFATESFLAQLVNKLLPVVKTSEPDMQIECSVLAARAEDGVVTLDPGFVLRSQRVDLSARGAIDLNDESLALRFDNQARKGLGISAASLVNPYVQIGGTLSSPSLGLDVTSSAIAGGAAIATGGLSSLAKPLYGRFLKRSNPCEVAIKRWEENALATNR
ncbi:MAG: hypothetical protein Cons2KO_29110 [Congregibacter sp.]